MNLFRFEDSFWYLNSAPRNDYCKGKVENDIQNTMNNPQVTRAGCENRFSIDEKKEVSGEVEDEG